MPLIGSLQKATVAAHPEVLRTNFSVIATNYRLSCERNDVWNVPTHLSAVTTCDHAFVHMLLKVCAHC